MEYYVYMVVLGLSLLLWLIIALQGNGESGGPSS
jgi:hypothetical protein